ncbi:MAG: zinc ribbon domain-containing protein [Anaerolineales bacterium]|nr:zinc ribbon domain-containing protein [Anaerolineales bacterium]
MPIFEFHCSECGSSFEELLLSASAIDQVICPSCESSQVVKKISLFAAKTQDGATSSMFSSPSSCSTGSV